jgi:hypothetical protein
VALAKASNESSEEVNGNMRTSAFDRKPEIEALAKEQGVSPIVATDELKATFWPVDEKLDEFLEARKRWQAEGRSA